MDADRAASALAARQRGVITRAQLRALGLSADAIWRRRRRGWLTVVHRGVYAVGSTALPEFGRELAAVLACGDGAVLSHRSAAAAWGFAPAADTAPVHVTVAGRNCGVKRGVHVHRVGALHPPDLTGHAGIPITSPARTLLDLATGLPAREFERAFDEAQVQGLITPRGVADVLGRHPGRAGAARLSALIAEDRRSATVTRSHAEERFLALVRRARLPAPEVNARLGGYSVDFLWREELVVVEIDGFRFHSTRGAFERDHEKDLALRRLNVAVLRFTWRQVDREHEASLVALATTLAARRRALA